VNWRSITGRWIGLPLVARLLVLASKVVAGGLEDARRRGKLLVGVKTNSPPFGYRAGIGRHEHCAWHNGGYLHRGRMLPTFRLLRCTASPPWPAAAWTLYRTTVRSLHC
jgi:hypothetical protein